MLLFYVTFIFIKILDQYSRFQVKFNVSNALKIKNAKRRAKPSSTEASNLKRMDRISVNSNLKFIQTHSRGSPFLSDLSLVSLPDSSYFLARTSLPHSNSPLGFELSVCVVVARLADLQPVPKRHSGFQHAVLVILLV